MITVDSSISRLQEIAVKANEILAANRWEPQIILRCIGTGEHAGKWWAEVQSDLIEGGGRPVS